MFPTQKYKRAWAWNMALSYIRDLHSLSETSPKAQEKWLASAFSVHHECEQREALSFVPRKDRQVFSPEHPQGVPKMLAFVFRHHLWAHGTTIQKLQNKAWHIGGTWQSRQHWRAVERQWRDGRGPERALEDTFSNGVEIIGRTVFSTDFPSLVKEKSKHAHLETKKPRLKEILNLRRMLA